MLQHYILELDGSIREEPDLITWATWYEIADNRVIAHDKVSDGILVSTIFLGIDHNFFGEGPQILFETMTFGLPNGFQHRYATKREALVGHADILAQVQRAVACN